MNKIDVSIVIVCMNNYGQLKDCLDSIKKHTHKVTYETLVVAYMFSQENLDLLRSEFPWVTIIISDTLRGFSENNNLALRKAVGKYCFVVNDDTYMTSPLLDELVETIEKIGDATLVSPKIVGKDGKVQYSGIPYISWTDWMKIICHFKEETQESARKFVQYTGVFQTYNILGAAFLIKTKEFRQLGFLDERYYFGPEDKALGNELNRAGYKCYVNANVSLTHLGGATGGVQSRTVRATRPANRKGCAIMYSEGNSFRLFLLELFIFTNSMMMAIYWTLKLLIKKNDSYKNSLMANVNVCRTIFLPLSTTQIFKKFYLKK